jgi:hypothetical protein
VTSQAAARQFRLNNIRTTVSGGNVGGTQEQPHGNLRTRPSIACKSTRTGLTTHRISLNVIWFEIGAASLDVPAAEIAYPNSTAYEGEKGAVSANSPVG